MKVQLRRLTLAIAFSMPAGAAMAGTIEILSTSGCGCCVAWAEHMQANGFETNLKYLPMADLWTRKAQLGLKPGLTSCHTALVGGYAIEGHVPVREVRRLLAEKPEAVGLIVPDMPYGSPGMGEAGPDAEPYDVLLLRKDGSTEIFASYR